MNAFATDAAGRQMGLQAVPKPGREFRGVDVTRVQREQLIARVAQPTAGSGIGIEDIARFVMHDDGIVDRFKENMLPVGGHPFVVSQVSEDWEGIPSPTRNSAIRLDDERSLKYTA